LTSEQLQAARAEKWRQKANPVLTIEEAEAWIASIGISLFLPRKTQLQAPAPSFVEAVSGETNATPTPAAIQNAFDMAIRLTASGAAIPLNLLGAVTEQPDFLASPEALPFIFATRGDRDWKRGPRDKSSPLVVETWKTLKREGVLTAPELQELLGREVTEAAVLRALSELWGAMRVLPVYAAGEVTAWELFEANQQKAAQAGGGMAQAMALSALVSLYLDAVIAANSDEIETFLSPLAPRSRIREVVRGIAATRQLGQLTLGSQTLYFIAGGLPEFPVIEPPAEADTTGEKTTPAETPARRRPYGQRDNRESQDRPARTPFVRGDRPTFGKRFAAGGGERKPFKPRDSDGPRREWQPRGEQRPFERKDWKPRREGAGDERREFRPRREAGEGGGFKRPFRKAGGDQPRGESFEQRPPRREFKPRENRPFEKKEWKPRREGSGEFRPRREGESGEKREFRPRRTEGRSGFNKPFRGRTGDRPSGGSFQRPPRKDWKPRGEGAGSERREFRPRREGESSEKREFRPRRSEGGFKPRREGAGDERREFKPRRTEGGFKPRREGGSFGDRPKSGERRPFSSSARSGDRKPPQRERSESGSGEKRPGKSFGRPGSKPGGKFGKKPAFGAKRPSRPGGRPGGKPSFGKRPGGKKKSGE
jgi:23S rRNA pseudouridine2605 synthase